MALPLNLHPPVMAAPLRAADGTRLLVVRDGGTSIWTGDGAHVTPRYSELARAAALQLPDGCVLEGAAPDDGTSFIVLDLLAIDHQDLRTVPAAVRRVRLEALAAGWSLPWVVAGEPAPVEVAPPRRPRRSRRFRLEPTV